MTWKVQIILKEASPHTQNRIIIHGNVKSKGTDGCFFVVTTEDDRTIYYSNSSVVEIQITANDNSGNRSQT